MAGAGQASPAPFQKSSTYIRHCRRYVDGQKRLPVHYRFSKVYKLQGNSFSKTYIIVC